MELGGEASRVRDRLSGGGWSVSYDSTGTNPATAYLSFRKSPKVDSHADQVVETGVGALVQQDGHQRAERQHHEAGLDASVEGGGGDGAQGPFPREDEQAEEEVDDLQDGDRLHGAVEVLGREVPEDFGPEEALQRGHDLICHGPLARHQREGRRQDDLQAAAVKTIRRAQWFLMSFPIADGTRGSRANSVRQKQCVL